MAGPKEFHAANLWFVFFEANSKSLLYAEIFIDNHLLLLGNKKKGARMQQPSEITSVLNNMWPSPQEARMLTKNGSRSPTSSVEAGITEDSVFGKKQELISSTTTTTTLHEGSLKSTPHPSETDRTQRRSSSEV